MVGDEGTSSCTSRDHVHHRSLNLDKVKVVQISSDEANDFRSHNESFSNLLVHNQVQISLSESSFRILKPDVRLWKHVKAGRKEQNLSWGNGKFISVGSAGTANDSDDISSPEDSMILFECFFSLVIATVAHDLQFFSFTSDIIENKVFSLAANVGDSPSNSGLLFVENSLFGVIFEGVDELANGQLDIELMRIRICLRTLHQLVHHR